MGQCGSGRWCGSGSGIGVGPKREVVYTKTKVLAMNSMVVERAVWDVELDAVNGVEVAKKGV